MICYKCETNKPTSEFFQGMQTCKTCAMNAHIEKVGNIRHEWKPPMAENFGAPIGSIKAVKKTHKAPMLWCDGCKKEHPKAEFHYLVNLCRACRAIRKKEKVLAKRDDVNKRRRERYVHKPKKLTRIYWEEKTEQQCKVCNEVKKIDAFRWGNQRCKECVRILDRQDRAANPEFYRLKDIVKDVKRGRNKLDAIGLQAVIQKLNAIKEQKKAYPTHKATDSEE